LKAKTLLFAAVAGVFLPLLLAGKAAGEPPRDKYAKWIEEEVPYLITQTEKEVYQQLLSDREKDLFIDAFWKQRDPTPGTDQNEFREEHERRIQYANQWYGRGTTTPGWKTDRGRIFIILGKPVNVESYGQNAGVVPVEAWYYQGLQGKGLPASFHVVFFQENEVGDFILYSPVRHGPRKLMESYSDNPANAYAALRKLDRMLADLSLSLIPGEPQSLYAKPSLTSEVLLQTIAKFPQNKIDDRYAENLLKYKEIIEVDHSVNYVGNDALVKVMPDVTGAGMVHYAVEPERLSLSAYEGNYAVELKAYGRLTDLRNVTVYQFEKSVPLRFASEDLEELKKKRFSFQDVFPLLPGEYEFSLLLKNTASQEFTTFEKKIVVPEPAAAARLSPLVLGYRERAPESGTRGFRPFQFDAVQLYPTAQMLFTPREGLVVYFQVAGLPPEGTESGQMAFALAEGEAPVFEERNSLSELKRGAGYLKRIPLEAVRPGMYTLTASLLDSEGRVLATQKDNCVVTSVPAVPRPWSLAQINPEPGDVQYFHILGLQYLNAGSADKAALIFEECLRLHPDSLPFAASAIQARFLLGDFAKVRETARPFMDRAAQEPALYYYMGKSCQATGAYAEAGEFYRNYLQQFGTNLDILNSLGECYLLSGDRERALQTWEKSLEIDPQQDSIRARIDKTKKGE